MVNSSLRNTLARRNHKERAQPLNRQRLGLLEKHKDYVHRARDYKSKQDRIRKLREKAAFRNKDEFYWGMVKGKTKAGVALGDRGNEALSMDLIKVLKTQDAGYVKVQIAKDEKKIAKIRAELEVNAPAAGPSSSEWSAASELAEVEKMAEMGIILRPRETESSRRKGKSRAQVPTDSHVLFVDDQAEFSSYGVNETSSSQEDIQEETPIDLGWEEEKPTPITSKSKAKSKTKILEQPRGDDEVEDARAYRLELLSSLSSYLARVRLLRQAETKLSTTKGHMGKGGAARVKRPEGWVEDDSVPEDRNGERKRFEGKVWKWKLERRR